MMMMMTLAVLLCLFLQLALFPSSSAVESNSDGIGMDPQLQPRVAIANKADFHELLLSYQHEMLRFHLDGQTNSGQIYYYYCYYATNLVLIVSDFPLQPVKSPLSHLVPSKSGKGGRRFLAKRSPIGFADIWEVGRWRIVLLPEPNRPTFTPYIGSRALSNLYKFFEHLRENLDAILMERSGRGRESKQGTEELEKNIAPPPRSRRSFPSKSELILSQKKSQTGSDW